MIWSILRDVTNGELNGALVLEGGRRAPAAFLSGTHVEHWPNTMPAECVALARGRGLVDVDGGEFGF